MILLITDLHCQYHLVDAQVAFAEQTTGCEVGSVIVLGDFGLFEHSLRSFFREQNRRFGRKVYFIEGNHEEFTAFDDLARQYSDCFTHLPRGTVHSIDGYRILALGGAAYMDAATTPMGCEIQPRDIQACLALPADGVDIVLSHDCPRGIGVRNSPGFEHYGAPGFPRGKEIAAHLSPRLWVFGHHHRWFESEQGTTRYVGLAESWKGFALLDSSHSLRVVKNFIDPPPGFWGALWGRLKRFWGG